MPKAFSVAPVSDVRDRRDLAACYLNLSRTGGDVVPYRVGGKPAFLINRPDYAKYVLATFQDNYKNPYHPYAELAGYYTPTGAFLLRLNRQASVQTSHLERIADELVAVLTETVVQLLERSRSGPINVDVETKRMMFRIITRVLFDVDPEHLSDDFVHAISFIEGCWANQLFSNPSPAPDPLERRYLEAIAIQDRTAAWIACKARMVLAGEQVPGQLIMVIVRTLLNSYNATATGLCWIIYQLTRSDAVLERLHAEVDRVIGSNRPTISDLPRLSYTRMVVMETLRLYPPAWIVSREAIAGHWLGTTFIPPGAVISVSPYTMQRHARFWERPNEFIPERFASWRAAEHPPYTYFPFGGGTRRCPAGRLVIGHLQLLLAAFLQQCRIESSLQEPIKPRGLIALRPHPEVWVRFTPRV